MLNNQHALSAGESEIKWTPPSSFEPGTPTVTTLTYGKEYAWAHILPLGQKTIISEWSL